MKISYEIKIKFGDLLDAQAGYLVNPSNTAMLLGSGVSMAFKRRCGSKLEEYMQEQLKIKDIKQGDVVKTASNHINFPFVLHAAVMNYTDKSKPKAPSLNTIVEILNNLQEIVLQDQNKHIKIALPLMGCGAGGLDKREVISEYKCFFKQNLDAEKECEVEIYGFSESDFRLLKEIMKKS